MPLPGWIRRRRISLTISLTSLSLLLLAKAAEPPRNWLPDPPERKEPVVASCPAISNPDPLMGPRTRMPGRWKGLVPVSPDLPIVVMAGHADSQNMDGSGTPGYAVDVELGRQRGLNISGYTPPALTIRNHRDPSTNWAQAKKRSARGDYILEIHFDAYSPYGFGSGLIPAINRNLNVVDESLANAFGRFPRDFRGGLGGPRRGIGILEIGMLQGELETRLRDPIRSAETIQCLASRVVDALARGVGRS